MQSEAIQKVINDFTYVSVHLSFYLAAIVCFTVVPLVPLALFLTLLFVCIHDLLHVMSFFLSFSFKLSDSVHWFLCWPWKSSMLIGCLFLSLSFKSFVHTKCKTLQTQFLLLLSKVNLPLSFLSPFSLSFWLLYWLSPFHFSLSLSFSSSNCFSSQLCFTVTLLAWITCVWLFVLCSVFRIAAPLTCRQDLENPNCWQRLVCVCFACRGHELTCLCKQNYSGYFWWLGKPFLSFL